MNFSKLMKQTAAILTVFITTSAIVAKHYLYSDKDDQAADFLGDNIYIIMAGFLLFTFATIYGVLRVEFSKTKISFVRKLIEEEKKPLQDEMSKYRGSAAKSLLSLFLLIALVIYIYFYNTLYLPEFIAGIVLLILFLYHVVKVDKVIALHKALKGLYRLEGKFHTSNFIPGSISEPSEKGMYFKSGSNIFYLMENEFGDIYKTIPDESDIFVVFSKGTNKVWDFGGLN